MDTKTLEKAQQLVKEIKKYEGLIDAAGSPSSIIAMYSAKLSYTRLSLDKSTEDELLNTIVNAWKEEKRLLEKEFNSL